MSDSGAEMRFTRLEKIFLSVVAVVVAVLAVFWFYYTGLAIREIF